MRSLEPCELDERTDEDELDTREELDEKMEDELLLLMFPTTIALFVESIASMLPAPSMVSEMSCEPEDA